MKEENHINDFSIFFLFIQILYSNFRILQSHLE